MLKIHPDAVPLMVTDNAEDLHVGWRLETRDFAFDAIEQEDGSVNTYVLWGDDQPGDMASHSDMSDAKNWLDSLLQASRR